MKNKFLALAAFGAAALGSAIVSTPANAQIPQGSGPTSPITVNVSVPEVLYLRTITTANLVITPTDLTAVALTGLGPGVPPTSPFIGSNQGQEAGGTVDTASPFAGGFADGVPVEKTITSAYIVWSNAPSNYEVQVTAPVGGFVGPGGDAVTAAVVGTNPASFAPEGLINSTPRDIVLDLAGGSGDLTAGTYTGVLTVEAFRP
ncbi:hypothetical protein Nos7524_4099 [Nostoc sp. PCC 7524]|uniref:hypothetical protein n=1 Tax=Nostoc sp. (strain ATCC 29411 / PCC 7524) TaxID=28072 RepID=UPI00029EE799|nr:hypothetical protein [Nostoc sp. PCC 7524]AFY49869.1 hypothetical protein Nos7524_4099 [Nostoc sp. PCC 7524]